MRLAALITAAVAALCWPVAPANTPRTIDRGSWSTVCLGWPGYTCYAVKRVK